MKTDNSGIIAPIKYAIVIFEIVAITMIGLLRTAYVLDAFTFSIIPMILCIMIVIFTHDYSPFQNRKFIIWDVLLMGLFILMLSAEEIIKMILKMESELYNYVFMCVYPIALIFSVLVVVDFALWFVMLNKDPRCKTESLTDGATCNGKFLGIYYETWLVIAVSYIFVVAYFPGNLNNDFNPDWIFSGQPTEWSDWHTVGFAFFVRFCTLIIRKAYMVTIGQALIYYWVTNYCVGFIKRRFSQYHYLSWIFTVMYSFFGFYTIMYVGGMMKDNNSAPLLLAFGVAVLDYIMSKNHSRYEYVNLIVFGFLASIFRHILIEVVAVTFVCMILGELLRDKKLGGINKKKIAVVSGSFMAVIVMYLMLTEVLAFGILKAERNPKYVSYTYPMNLAASLAYRNEVVGLPIDDEIVEMMEQVIPLEKWAEYYCPWDADVIARPWHEIGDNVLKVNDPKIATDIIKVNVWYLKTYPVQYLLSFFDLNSPVWEIAKASDLIMYCPNHASDFTNVHHMKKGAFFDIAEEIRLDSGSQAIGKALFYRGGIYLYSFVLITLIMFMKKRVLEWIGMLPIILQAMSLLISIPQSSAQYIMGFPLFATFFGVFACMIDINSERKHD